MSLEWSAKNILGLKSVLNPLLIGCDMVRRNVRSEFLKKRKHFWLILPVVLTQTQSSLSL